ncbi:MAG: hypothetical protein II889_06240, partial [Clostridia bacterium]|nr:hypothetical protein [Clostridia bacterium]
VEAKGSAVRVRSDFNLKPLAVSTSILNSEFLILNSLLILRCPAQARVYIRTQSKVRTFAGPHSGFE